MLQHATPYVQYVGTFQAESPPHMASHMFKGSPDFRDHNTTPANSMATEPHGANKRRFMPTVEEALPVRYLSGTDFITDAPPIEPIVIPWGVDRETFRGVLSQTIT